MVMNTICFLVGARPQFIKLAPLVQRCSGKFPFFIIHTGQHYDDSMSKAFFRDLALPPPEFDLGVGSGSHAGQTGAMLVGIEKILLQRQPGLVVVFGDTNSTVAGALAAAKIHIPVAHVEAGLRSFNRKMPEEINRVLTDHISDLLLCPGRTAVLNLKKEGIISGVHVVGDIMGDALLFALPKAQTQAKILERLGLETKKYLLATLHRPENTDDRGRLGNIINAFSKIDETIILPLHPRTRKMISQFALENFLSKNVKVIDPLGYLEMVWLEKNARLILTDSGGMQKEAYWLKVPCVTLRDETEWLETVAAGWNVLAGADSAKIAAAVADFKPVARHVPLYGAGQAAELIVTILAGSHLRR
jgi:UDP-N-acetylglucosamine 2-epimerase